MRRIRLIIEYDGTGYVGWQIQSNGIAVQYVIERELNKLTGENCVLHASGSACALSSQYLKAKCGCRPLRWGA